MRCTPQSAKLAARGNHALSSEEVVAFLMDNPLLVYVPQEHIRRLADRCYVRQYRKGAVLFRREDPSNWVYFIYLGSVTEIISFGGSEDVISTLHHPGEYIGEMGMIVGEPYVNTAIARENVIAVAMPREGFMELTETYTTVANYITGQFVRRLLKSSQRHISAMHLNASGRLGFTLLSLVDRGETHCRAIRVTQSDLAASAGIARQTVAGILREWRQLGWIQTERGQLTICDEDALLNVINDSELK